MKEGIAVDIEELFYVWVTAVGGHVDHAVTDAENAARLRKGRAEYVALCGDEFHGADMRDAPGHQCPRCSETIDAWFERSSLINRVLSRPRETQAAHGRHACRVPRPSRRVSRFSPCEGEPMSWLAILKPTASPLSRCDRSRRSC